MPATITIELKALRFFGHHGWHEEEAILGNDFEVAIFATFPSAGAVVSIEDTVDYTRIYALAKRIFMQREKLLETVAHNISSAIEKEFSDIKHLQISITKLAPPVVSFTGTVGITYTKTF